MSTGGPDPRRPKTRLVLVFGGRSAEHEISVASAASVMDALDPDRFDVIPIGIDKRLGPIALQIVGPIGSDMNVLQFAAKTQTRFPPVFARS